MFKASINKLNKQFIKEANESPQLLEDMAAMEKYMAESYSGRMFVELLQNAEDCGSKKVKLFKHNKHVVFANNGRPFNEDDILAISRSGASKKKRGTTIGYRGIGFKSTTYITNEIIIYSSDAYFTFSKPICAKYLKMEVDKVPTIRIPFLIDNIQDDLKDIISKLKEEGYTTVFIFMNAQIEELIEEILEVSNSYFIFLSNIELCEVDVEKCVRKFKICRENKDGYCITSLIGSKNEQWIIVKKNDIQLAFKYQDNRIVACEEDEAVYHCYLPTLDKMAWPFKVNSDFSTDPSRKHLTLDERTRNSLQNIGEEIFNLVAEILNSKEKLIFDNVIELIVNRISFSRISNMVVDSMKKSLCSLKRIKVGSKMITANAYKVLPEWLDEAECLSIRLNSEYVQTSSLQLEIYHRIPIVDDYLKQYSSNKYTLEDLVKILEDKEFIKTSSVELVTKIYVNVIRGAKSSQMISGKKYTLENLYIKGKSDVYKISEIKYIDKIKLEEEFVVSIKSGITNNELEWFCMNTSISKELFNVESDYIGGNKKTIDNILQKESNLILGSKEVTFNKGVSISKWRSAEQQCIEIEKMLGNTARDVSKQNVGYDIESTTCDGRKRFIEVKSVKYIGNSFSLTNNEYTAAHQYGEQYFLCIISQDEDKLEYEYISNPLQKLNLQKRIRQWEWYCEQYDGEKVTINL